MTPSNNKPRIAINPAMLDADVAQYAITAHLALMQIEAIARRFDDVAVLREISEIARNTQMMAPIARRRDRRGEEAVDKNKDGRTAQGDFDGLA
jgi:hypothetical protein